MNNKLLLIRAESQILQSYVEKAEKLDSKGLSSQFNEHQLG